MEDALRRRDKMEDAWVFPVIAPRTPPILMNQYRWSSW